MQKKNILNNNEIRSLWFNINILDSEWSYECFNIGYTVMSIFCFVLNSKEVFCAGKSIILKAMNSGNLYLICS